MRDFNTIMPKMVNFDRMLYNKEFFEASFSYERYMGRIKLKELPNEILQKSIIDPDSPEEIVFLRDHVKRRLNVATTKDDLETRRDKNAPESFYKNQKRAVLGVLREHLHELQRVREVFDQFKPIYQREMLERVQTFIKRPENSLDLKDQYSEFLNELRRYRNLARELPERVAFPLFEVGTSIVKEEIQTRIDRYIVKILQKFEYDLSTRSENICGNFQEIADHYNKRLETAEDVVEIENYKNNLQL